MITTLTLFTASYLCLGIAIYHYIDIDEWVVSVSDMNGFERLTLIGSFVMQLVAIHSLFPAPSISPDYFFYWLVPFVSGILIWGCLFMLFGLLCWIYKGFRDYRPTSTQVYVEPVAWYVDTPDGPTLFDNETEAAQAAFEHCNGPHPLYKVP